MLLFIIQKRRYRKLSKFRMNQFQQTNIFFNDFAIFTIIIISLSSMLIEISAHQFDHNVDDDQSLNRSVSINHMDTMYKMPIMVYMVIKRNYIHHGFIMIDVNRMKFGIHSTINVDVYIVVKKTINIKMINVIIINMIKNLLLNFWIH